MSLSDLEEFENKELQQEASEKRQVTGEDYVNMFWAQQAEILKNSFVNTAFILINVIIFIISIFFDGSLYESFGLDSSIIAQGKEYYRLFTCMFLHASLDHIASNMIILFFVGANVEHDLGHINYGALYLLSGVIGSLVSVFIDMQSGAYSLSIGASGAVFGVMGAVLVIVIFGRKYLKQRRSTLMKRLALMLFFSIYSGFADSEINNAAHIGGLIGGIIFTILITILGRKEYKMEEWI